MNCLVTGGNGFIGSHLVDYLVNNGHNVISIDDLSGSSKKYENPKAKYYYGSITDKSFCDKCMKDIDVVYHLAAYAAEIMSLYIPIHIANNNLVGTTNLIVSSVNHNIDHFIFVSSMSVYGDSKIPYTEDDYCEPKDTYGLFKLTCEKLLKIYHDSFGLKYSILRPHNVYGPRQYMEDPYRNVLTIWVNRILKNEPPIIYGDGNQERSFTYIKDIIPIIAKAKDVEGIYNIGPIEPITINDACIKLSNKMEAKGFSVKDSIHKEERLQEVKIAYSENKKANYIFGEIGWTSLDDGLELFINWIKKEKIKPVDFKFFETVEIDRGLPSFWKNIE